MLQSICGFEKQRNRTMRLCLAGGDRPDKLDVLLKVGAPNIMMSYFYLKDSKDKGEAFLRRAKDAGCWVFIDSGAHKLHDSFSWLQIDKLVLSEKDGCKRDGFYTNGRTDEDAFRVMYKYFEEYFNWIKSHQEYLDAFSELDLDNFVGIEKQWKWREQWLREGLKPVVTTHSRDVDIDDEVERMIDSGFSYIGVPHNDLDELRALYANHMDKIHLNRILIHWWKFGTKLVNDFPFFSVSSNRWISGEKYGRTYVYGGNYKMKEYSNADKEVRKTLKVSVEEAGLNFEAFLADDWKTVTTFNAYHWVKWSKDMMEYPGQAYWLSDEEKEIRKARIKKAKTTALVRHNSKKTAIDKIKLLEFARTCNTCFLADKCPVYEEDSTCRLAERIKVDGADDIAKVLNMVISVQSERVMFANFVEKMLGIPLSESTTKEMEYLVKMIKQIKEIYRKPKDRMSIEIESSEGNKGGILTSLFGDFVAEKTKDVVEAKVVEVKEMKKSGDGENNP